MIHEHRVKIKTLKAKLRAISRPEKCLKFLLSSYISISSVLYFIQGGTKKILDH